MNLFVKKLNPAVEKHYLMLMAACIWLFASVMLSYRGVQMLLECPSSIMLKLLISVPTGIIFYILMFDKIAKKHSKRIIEMENKKTCLFAFFDWKAYLMMTLMITMGIVLRKLDLVPINYLSFLYITMAIPLFISALKFLFSWIKMPK